VISRLPGTDPDAASGRFVVVCRRWDGREREFQRYADLAEAESIAKRLTAIGCPSRVVGPQDPDLEANKGAP
jgi:hypothetical protein